MIDGHDVRKMQKLLKLLKQRERLNAQISGLQAGLPPMVEAQTPEQWALVGWFHGESANAFACRKNIPLDLAERAERLRPVRVCARHEAQNCRVCLVKKLGLPAEMWGLERERRLEAIISWLDCLRSEAEWLNG